MPRLHIRGVPNTLPARLGRSFVRWIERLLLRRYGIYEFDRDERCIMRVAWQLAPRRARLSDGTTVRRGDLVGELHFWNDHMPRMRSSGADLAWSRAFVSSFAASLGSLAIYVDSQPRFDEVRAFRGDIMFATRNAENNGEAVMRALGFDFARVPYAATLRGRWREFWENFFSLMLLWTYNPGDLQGKGPLRVRRFELWMSRETMRRKYAKRAGRY